MARDQVQLLHELAGRVLLLQVVYERDRALGLLGFVGHEQARAPARRGGGGASPRGGGGGDGAAGAVGPPAPLRLPAPNRPEPTPAGGAMSDPSMEGKGKTPTSKSCTDSTMVETCHVPVGATAAWPEEQTPSASRGCRGL